MTDITELAQSLKAAAEKATPGPWEVQFGEEIYATDGVDNEQVAIATLDARDADYIALANPANVLALVEALERKEEQRANWFQMAQKLGEDLDAAEKRITELENYAEAEAVGVDRAAEDSVYWMKRCKELESRTVKLPDALLPATHKSGELFMTPDNVEQGGYLNRDDVLRVLRNAGIKVEAE
ncbi:TPA: ead/Ea22-like family protein [Klebsiella pneumoniae]|nr:ead/Ea22-like family protein [Klebsiella pneumoniae]HBX2070742.1 ead/Ea22-like family protein [Klebsiella pneumoniae]